MLPVDDDTAVQEVTSNCTQNVTSVTSTLHTTLRLRGGGKTTKKSSTPSSQQLSTDNISIMYTNADSLGNKLDELGERIRDIDPSIVAVNEVKHKGNYIVLSSGN